MIPFPLNLTEESEIWEYPESAARKWNKDVKMKTGRVFSDKGGGRLKLRWK